MSFQSPNATLPPPGLTARPGDLFASEVAALVQDIQRTRDWFNSQLDAQLSALRQLCATAPSPMPAEEPKGGLSMATLFEAPRPVSAPLPPPVVEVVATPEASKVTSVHQAIVLPPTLTATLDPHLEQATLHELNNALTRAFSEISARGGMIG
ncbi:hypothetical protein [Prosthecobacter sp.]|uniref:hypothetical protein n=1 Tax=Prosthecobacter sp. TaxID=1965333 RepID=UPI00378490FE